MLLEQEVEQKVSMCAPWKEEICSDLSVIQSYVERMWMPWDLEVSFSSFIVYYNRLVCGGENI